jgi:PBP1b-binding outer membrane lipoprotein LpoB
MKLKRKILIVLTAIFVLSCNKEEIAEDETVAIIGQWFLTTVNEIDVSSVACYNESYIESNGERIEFYILDRLEDGSCQQVLNESSALTIQDDFYYIGDEALDMYIEGRILTWRVDFETTLVFQKR